MPGRGELQSIFCTILHSLELMLPNMHSYTRSVLYEHLASLPPHMNGGSNWTSSSSFLNFTTLQHSSLEDQYSSYNNNNNCTLQLHCFIFRHSKRYNIQSGVKVSFSAKQYLPIYQKSDNQKSEIRNLLHKNV
jgi:hypothetical protein